jgi:hypothetical protein
MALQYSVTLRNNQLDAIETTISTTPVLKLFTGAQPANCAAANTGTELWTETLPSDWMAAASSGSKALSGTWQALGIAAGTAAHFRLYASDGTTCHAQGSVTSVLVGTGDMLLDNVVIAVGQSVTISTFTVAAGNA